VINALAAEGHLATLARVDRESLGFFVCVADLEDELLRAAGTGLVQQLISAKGDAAIFAAFQGQPANRTQSLHDQVRGFLRTRKVEYGPLIADAIPMPAIPTPLAGLLAHV
jgi:hypothetical protein